MAKAKNQEYLVASGRWRIDNFKRFSTRCMCCGRPIVNVLKLKNDDHEGRVATDPTYKFPEVIDIGSTCGPRVFMESTKGFYDMPEHEWNRQWNLWKGFINHMIFLAQAAETWEKEVDVELRGIVDAFISSAYLSEDDGKAACTNGKWWRVHHAQKDFLKSVMPLKKTKTGRVIGYPYSVKSITYRAYRLLDALVAVDLINEGDWIYNRTSGFTLRPIVTLAG